MAVADLKPKSAIGLLDASFGLFRAHFAPLLTIWLLVLTPTGIVGIFVSTEAFTFISLAGNLLTPLAAGATAIYTASVIHDRPATLGESFRQARYGSVLGAQILSSFLVFFGMLLLIVPGFIALAATAVAMPVCSIERLHASRAIERSRELTRGFRWHAFRTVFLATMLTVILTAAVGGGVAAFGAMLNIPDGARNLITQVLAAVFYPVATIVATLLYFDLRVRREGADIEALIAEGPAAVAAT